jgi:hypothetical protein
MQKQNERAVKTDFFILPSALCFSVYESASNQKQKIDFGKDAEALWAIDDVF